MVEEEDIKPSVAAIRVMVEMHAVDMVQITRAATRTAAAPTEEPSITTEEADRQEEARRR